MTCGETRRSIFGDVRSGDDFGGDAGGDGVGADAPRLRHEDARRLPAPRRVVQQELRHLEFLPFLFFCFHRFAALFKFVSLL